MKRHQLFTIRCLIPIQALFCRLGPGLLSNNAQIKILLLRSFGKYFVPPNNHHYHKKKNKTKQNKTKQTNKLLYAS